MLRSRVFKPVVKVEPKSMPAMTPTPPVEAPPVAAPEPEMPLIEWKDSAAALEMIPGVERVELVDCICVHHTF